MIEVLERAIREAEAAGNTPLDPSAAAQLFYSGERMLLLSAPAQVFVYARWQNQPCMSIVPLPFNDATVYFTANPAMLAAAYIPPAPGQPVYAKLRVRIGGITLTGVDHMNLPNGQSVDLTATFYDAQDNPTTAPTGDVTWTSSNTAFATVAANPNNDDEATVTSVAVGEATITMSVGSITATIDVAVTGDTDAVSATITAGEPYTTPVTTGAKSALAGATGSAASQTQAGQSTPQPAAAH
jgi:hypothetical protein